MSARATFFSEPERGAADTATSKVAGEAGVGKTALLGPLIDVAEATRGEFERVVTTAGPPHEVVSALLRGCPGEQ